MRATRNPGIPASDYRMQFGLLVRAPRRRHPMTAIDWATVVRRFGPVRVTMLGGDQ